MSVTGAEVSFFLPLSVVPLYVKSSGSESRRRAGHRHCCWPPALLLATVAAELATPQLVHRVGYRLSLAAGLVLFGAPALALLWPAGRLWWPR